jgi:hypothetical protein
LYYYPETTASGGGWIDYDGDLDLDLYLLNGAASPGSTIQGTPRNALYENRAGRWHDVAGAAGVDDPSYSMGMCVGDYDSDGLLDFLVTNFGADRLYRNLGHGRFQDVAHEAGVADPRWGSCCAFGDVNKDGHLDLYVSHYMDFSYDDNPWCGDRARDLRAYCRPAVLDGETDSLFINQGDGTFRDEGASRGLAQGVLEKGFGVVLTDLDNDDDLDIYVANDGTMNRLYVNDGTGQFQDQALLSGSGFNSAGLAESSMGLDLADLDENGLLDIIMGNYSMETNTLFKNHGSLLFEDVTELRGLADATHRTMTWGLLLMDFDNDGDLDLAQARGHTMDNIHEFESDLKYRQRNQLLENTGQATFRDVTHKAGRAWQVERVSRGLAAADWDDDGDLDLVFTNTNDRPDLLENLVGNRHHWIGLRLMGPAENRFAIGARGILRLGDRILTREVRSGGSFQSQSDLRLHFGLGDHQGPVEVEIVWPDWRRQCVRLTRIDQYTEVTYAPDSTGGC